MTNHGSTPQLEDLQSVGSRVSWAAILGGAALAFAIYFLLMVLGSAVGLSVRDRMDADSQQTAAIAWSIVTLCASLFLGGLITSLFTVGENKVEAVVYGVLVWAVLMVTLVVMSSVGAHGVYTMANLAYRSDSGTTPAWETMAIEAGVPRDQIDAWRQRAPRPNENAADQTARAEAATRFAWIAFGGTWVSMLVAAFGAWVGAGPTFRLVVVREPGQALHA